VVALGVSAARFRPVVDVVDEPLQFGVGEPAAPQVPHVHHRVAVSDAGAVAGDDVRDGGRVEQGAAELARVQAADESAGRLLGASQGPQGASEEFGRGRVGADEAGGRGDEPAGDDEVVQGDVVAAEPPPPDPVAGAAEDPQPVQAGVASALPAPVDPPPFQLVQDVLQSHHGGDRGVARDGQPGGHQPHGQTLTAGVLVPEGEASVFGGGVEPAQPLGLRVGVEGGGVGGERELVPAQAVQPGGGGLGHGVRRFPGGVPVTGHGWAPGPRRCRA